MSGNCSEPNLQRQRLLEKYKDGVAKDRDKRSTDDNPPPTEEPAPMKGTTVEPLQLVAIRDVPEILNQEWLVEGLIPRFEEGSAGYFFGAPKVKKSLLLSEIALSVTSGQKVMNRFSVNRTGAAVGFFAEDPKSETSRRIHRLARGKGIDVPPNLYLIDVPGLAIDDAKQQRALAATLHSVPDLVLVWLDPMVRLHTVNDNKAEELGPIHTFLRTLSRSLPGVVIVLAHHTNHGGGARGSTDYGAFGDFNLYLESSDELTTRMRKHENRGGPPAQPFSFRIEDLAADYGPALRLVVDEREPAVVAAERASVVAHTILSFKDSHPEMKGREAMEKLRTSGLKFGNQEFWQLWKKGER